MLVTKEDICKIVYDRIEKRTSTTKEELIQLLKNEIAFKEKCKEYRENNKEKIRKLTQEEQKFVDERKFHKLPNQFYHSIPTY